MTRDAAGTHDGRRAAAARKNALANSRGVSFIVSVSQCHAARRPTGLFHRRPLRPVSRLISTNSRETACAHKSTFRQTGRIRMNGDVQHPGSVLGSVFDFLKIVGASLTGLTAILTAAGFLAERARLTMLGLPSATFDLERYMETGALLLALLPVVMGIALLLILVSWARAVPESLFTLAGGSLAATILLVAGGLGIVLYLLKRREPSPPGAAQWVQQGLRASRGWFKRTGFGILLIVALLLQISSLNREVQVLELRDLLFQTEVDAAEDGVVSSELTVSGTDEIAAAVAYGRGSRSTAVRLFGQIVLWTTVNAYVLYYVIRKRMPETRSRGAHRMLAAWTGLTTLLLISQITLLPVSYGVLLSQNQYPEVCVARSGDALEDGERLPDARLSLVHQADDGLYLYSRGERKMWYVPRDQVRSVVHHARTSILDPAEPEPCRTDE